MDADSGRPDVRVYFLIGELACPRRDLGGGRRRNSW
jgi:hypothetical protein